MTTDMNKTEEQQKEEAKKLIAAIYSRSLHMLKVEFDAYKVEGQVINNTNFGPIFAYRLTDNDTSHQYSCGFFIRELMDKQKNAEIAQQWLASFYIDMIESGVSKPLPAPPSSQEESQKLFEEQIMPSCANAIREEFHPEQVYVNLSNHDKAGLVLEAGFPAIKTGNNVCAMPVPYLLTLYLLNRDPAEPLVNGLYNIRQEHGLQ